MNLWKRSHLFRFCMVMLWLVGTGGLVVYALYLCALHLYEASVIVFLLAVALILFQCVRWLCGVVWSITGDDNE